MILGLSGCGFLTWSRLSINDPIKPEDVRFIVPGRTTLSEVMARLGTPDELVGTKTGGAAFYHFRDLKYFRANYAWPLRFVIQENPDFVMAGAGLGADLFELVFDRQWVIRQYAFATHLEASRYRAWPFDPPARSSQPPFPEDYLEDPSIAY